DAAQVRRAVVDASPDALIGIDRDARIVSWNPAAQRIFGYDEEAAYGRRFDSLIAMRWLKRHPLVQTFDHLREIVGPVDLLCVRRDGGRFRATVAARP
ncbi:hypothetical protein CA831_30685, partial [Burkholderia multivorans]